MDFNFKTTGGIAVVTPLSKAAKDYLNSEYNVPNGRPVAMNEVMFMPFSVKAMGAGLNLQAAEDK